MPKVSIIVPLYNRLDGFLSRCLPSIQAQTFKDYELIVINNGDYIEPLPGMEWYDLPLAANKSRAVNFGVKKAKGKYIVVVDDDNELMPTFLKETVRAIEEYREPNPNLNYLFDAVCTGRIIKHLGFDDYAPAYRQRGYDFSSIDWGWLIKKEVFDKIQYDETIFGDEDADFGIQFFKHFLAYPLDKPLQIAYAEGDGVCTPTTRRLESLRRFYKKNKEEYKKAGPKDAGFLERYVARTHFLGGYPNIARHHFWLAFKAYPNRRTLTHFLVSLFKNYDLYYKLMRLEEKYYAKRRMAMPSVANAR